MSLYYIGGFPPPYGGVTIKNKNLYYALNQKIEIKKIDFNLIKRGNLLEAIRLVLALLNKNNRFAIGVAGKKTRKRLCRLIYTVNRKAMRNSVIFLMGGTASDDIAADSSYQKYVSELRCIYAETHGMVDKLKRAGLRNAGYYPNGRFKPERKNFTTAGSGQTLKCVFFSLISKEKGADIVLDAARALPDVSFSFYGHIDKNYQNEFLECIERQSNVSYHGVFSGTSDEVYQELGKYDVLLLPTRHKSEGVPGILVEAKIAGIPCVVSNKNYNAELIQHNKEGIVLTENTGEELSDWLKLLQQNPSKLDELKTGNHLSSENYYIENYIDQIVETIGKKR